MDERARLVAVLQGLRELRVGELFLDSLTAGEALRLAGGTAAAAGSTAPGGTVVADGVSQGSSPNGLEALAETVAGCVQCGLSRGRTQTVFGRGSAQAELVVVGEAPGYEEDRQGLPFVGPAGKMLDLLLLSAGFHRDRVYICNVLKCRPPNNRDPQPEEVARCAPYLHAQLDAIRPRALLAVGKFSAQMLAGSEAPIGRLRGRIHSYRGIPVVATYHPAYLLRTPAATRKTWLDLQRLRQVLDEDS